MAAIVAAMPFSGFAQQLPADCSKAAAPKQPLEVSVIGVKFTPKSVRLRRGNDVTMALGNRLGGAWTDLEHIAPSPAVLPRTTTDSIVVFDEGVGAFARVAGTNWMVWVSQPNDRVVAHMGELSAETLKNKGVLGCVADGFVRDVDFLIEMGFQTWSRGFTPRDIVGYWLPRAVDQDIRIGDVVVSPGDYLLGDRDGLLRVPKAIVQDVLEKAQAAVKTENKVRTAILAGMDPQQAYLQHGKF